MSKQYFFLLFTFNQYIIFCSYFKIIAQRWFRAIIYGFELLFTALYRFIDFFEGFGNTFGGVGAAFNHRAAQFKGNFFIGVPAMAPTAALTITIATARAGIAFLATAIASFITVTVVVVFFFVTATIFVF